MDGLDQTTIEISDKRMLKNFDVNKKYDPSILISLILNRRLLRKANLILTSRPEALEKIPISAKPEAVVFLECFEKEDVLDIIENSAENFKENGSK